MIPKNFVFSYWVTFTCCLLHLSKSQALLALSKALSNMTSPANCQKSALDFPDCCKLAVIWACYCTQWFNKSAVCILIIKYTGHFILNEYVTSCAYKHCSYYRGEVNSLLIKVYFGEQSLSVSSPSFMVYLIWPINCGIDLLKGFNSVLKSQMWDVRLKFSVQHTMHNDRKKSRNDSKHMVFVSWHTRILE